MHGQTIHANTLLSVVGSLTYESSDAFSPLIHARSIECHLLMHCCMMSCVDVQLENLGTNLSSEVRSSHADMSTKRKRSPCARHRGGQSRASVISSRCEHAAIICDPGATENDHGWRWWRCLPQDAAVAGNSPNDGEACTSRWPGGALHIGQGLGCCCRTDLVRGMSAWPRPRVDRQDGFQANGTISTTFCAINWLLTVPVVVIVVAMVTVFTERHKEVDGQRRMETMLFQHRSPRRHALFLQHTSTDYGWVQALSKSHTCSDFGFVTITPIILRISSRSDSLLTNSVAFGASWGTACTTPNPDVAAPSFACLPSAVFHK